MTYAPKTGEVLFKAVCFVLNYDDWKAMRHGAILQEFPIRGELHAFLVGGNELTLGFNGMDPRFELGHDLKRVDSKEENTTYTFQSTFTPKLNFEVKYEHVELRFYGDSETSGQILTSEIKKLRRKRSQKFQQKYQKSFTSILKLLMQFQVRKIGVSTS